MKHPNVIERLIIDNPQGATGNLMDSAVVKVNNLLLVWADNYQADPPIGIIAAWAVHDRCNLIYNAFLDLQTEAISAQIIINPE